jgi:transcriptional regulator with XRE-family HTH domain
MHGKFNMAKLKTVESPPPLPRKAAFIKQWRNFRKMSQARLAEAIDMSTGNLSNIENGKQPYIQDHLEAIACVLHCEVVDLILRNPKEPEGIWTLWARAKPEQRQQILKIMRALLSP